MENIKPAIGAIKGKKRVGRGPGSGMGKTSTRGHKGQKSRKGGGVRVGFEGGQTPLYRRLPKRGFKNSLFKNDYNEINIFMLNKFEENAVVKFEDLQKLGLTNSKSKKVKILGNGELTKKIEIHADKFSKSALSKIEAKGGKAVVIEKQ